MMNRHKAVNIGVVVFMMVLPVVNIRYSLMTAFSDDKNMYTPPEWVTKYLPVGAFDKRSNGNDSLKNAHSSSGLSACLLIMDDNERLPEWLAYHYQTLPLRHLIVAVDPESLTSPEAILSRWNKTDMDVTLWSDYDFMDAKFANVTPGTFDQRMKHKRYLKRQNGFLFHCMKEFQRRNRTWTMLLDSDEFLVLNPIRKDDPTKAQYMVHLAGYKKNHRFIHVTNSHNLTRLQTTSQVNVTRGERRFLTRANISLPFPTIHDFIQQEQHMKPFVDEPCVMLTRLFFGSKESGPFNETIQQHIPARFDPMQFDTLRYHWHEEKGCAKCFNGNGKVVVDVSRVNLETPSVSNPHHPLEECGDFPFIRYDESIFRVHHYLGSHAAYSKQNDDRRSDEVYFSRHNISKGYDEEINGLWLKNFVDAFGEKRAKELLSIE